MPVSDAREDKCGFVNTLNLQLTEEPDAISVGDLNGDEYPDIVVTSHGENDVAVFINDQESGFFAPVIYPQNFVGRFPELGDMDGDGDLDLVIRVDFDQITVLLNDGDGVFESTVSSTTPTKDPILFNTGMALGDVDGDGDLDVAVTGATIPLAAYRIVSLNDGTGNFSDQIVIPSASLPFKAFLLDINGDGNLDFGSARPLEFAYNNGDGTFADDGPVFSSSKFAAPADLDSDSDLDFATAFCQNDFVAIVENDGSGEFELGVTFDVSGYPSDILSRDFDNDGDFDVVTLNLDGTISLGENSGGASFPTVTCFPVGAKVDISDQLLAADFNRDGRLDLVTNSRNENRITFLFYRCVELGDMNLDEDVNLLDIMPFIEAMMSEFYIFQADLNCDGNVNLIDISYFVDRITG